MPGVGDWVRSIEPLMPRYFFHVHDCVDQLDTEGVELLDPREARAQAVIATGEALRDLDGALWDGDENGE
jgi:hypothetical protein